MKRDWELVRKILVATEGLESYRQQIDESNFPDYDREIVWHHIYLLEQAGLVKALCSKALSEPRSCRALELTWEGHEFLDKIRSQDMWSQINKLARQKGLSLSFEVIKAAATVAIGDLLTGGVG